MLGLAWVSGILNFCYFMPRLHKKRCQNGVKFSCPQTPLADTLIIILQQISLTDKVDVKHPSFHCSLHWLNSTHLNYGVYWHRLRVGLMQ